MAFRVSLNRIIESRIMRQMDKGLFVLFAAKHSAPYNTGNCLIFFVYIYTFVSSLKAMVNKFQMQTTENNFLKIVSFKYYLKIYFPRQ